MQKDTAYELEVEVIPDYAGAKKEILEVMNVIERSEDGGESFQKVESSKQLIITQHSPLSFSSSSLNQEITSLEHILSRKASRASFRISFDLWKLKCANFIIT